jgi:glutamate carboxypeptidase
MRDLEAVRSKVEARRKEAVEFLRHIVNLDSPSHRKDLTDVMGKTVAERARAIGMRVELDRQADFGDNVVARLSDAGPARRRPHVLMVGHMDTVYEAGTAAERPFRVEDGRAYGPGVHDMKGGLVIGLYALQAALEVTSEWGLTVTFVMNSDEEPGSPRSREVILREAARHDLALILEPGRPGPALTVARKGVGIFHLTVHGREAHAGAEPEKGVNAILDAALRVPEIAGLADPSVGTTATVGVIEGGTAPYVVPGRCRVGVDARVRTVAEQERVEAGLQLVAQGSRVEGTSADLTGSFHRPPMEPTEATYRYVERIQEAAAALGYPLGAESSGGASDGNLTAAAGVPTIDGLGTHGGRPHSPDEWIELDSVAHKTQVLAAFLAGLNQDEPR